MGVDVASIQELAERVSEQVERVLVGKPHVVQLALTAMLSNGHLLIEDNPGTGKTSLARALAASISGTSQRIQFTPDLLPGDITGVSVWSQGTREFEYRRGPVFANVVLADEINRASPKTQSALLEVMQEGRVTVDGVAHAVPQPFMVIATQNPIEHAGTYQLPEAQVDRFALKVSIGYPDHASTLRILTSSGEEVEPEDLAPIADSTIVLGFARQIRGVHVEASIVDYVARLVEATRQADEVRLGVSVRGALALVRTARAWAAIHGRDYVTPDDVKALAVPALAHRLVLQPEAEFDDVRPESIVQQLMLTVAPPRR
ncbi:AAA family ATPase [Agrococcus beijingensis]|uniref:AAA family ATPase n=1 Tax=Agrococcus beijingensis TaxID=3068634 RepID=UPI0027420336|nr:MoxR family ATPase [Agrococcus sp. REN33]